MKVSGPTSSWYRTILPWALPVVAVVMLALTLAPADIWRHPDSDAIYEGFDPNFVYVKGAGVRVSTRELDITAAPNTDSSANLSTTSLQSFIASIDVVIADNTAATAPFRIGVWSPVTGVGQFVVFGPAPLNLITAESLQRGSSGTTLIGGDILNRVPLGNYALGIGYHVRIYFDRAAARITNQVAEASSIAMEASVSDTEFPALFDSLSLSLTASVFPGSGTSRVVLRNYSLALPHERFWASRVTDLRATSILLCLVCAGLVLIGVAIASRLSVISPAVAFGRMWTRVVALRFRAVLPGRGLKWVLSAIALFLVGNASLFPLASHPFDMGNERLYAYVARVYGPAQLYYLPNVVSMPKIWGGIPIIASAFPYEPVVAYLFTGIGWLSSVLFAGGGSFGVSDPRLEYLIKAVNVVFGLADAAMIYRILRQLGVSGRRSLIGGGLFLFNPAVWFSTSVWGQTHTISLFLVLAAVLLAERLVPTGAWIALTAACLTRPQMLVFGILLAIVFLRKFSWTQNAIALSWTVVIVFIALAPLTLATSPSLPVDIMLNNFRIQEGPGNLVVQTTVSQNAYSVWPLVTYVAHGASGPQRSFTLTSELFVGPLTYLRVSQILTIAAILTVSSILLLRTRSTIRSGGYLPLIAVGVTAFLMLTTGLVATHFVLALPILLLCYRWMDTVAYLSIAFIWTVTTFVPMFGDMGVALSSQDYTALAPAHNAVTRLFIHLYRWDRFITVAVVANICAVVWLAYMSVRSTCSLRGTAATST